MRGGNIPSDIDSINENIVYGYAEGIRPTSAPSGVSQYAILLCFVNDGFYNRFQIWFDLTGSIYARTHHSVWDPWMTY